MQYAKVKPNEEVVDLSGSTLMNYKVIRLIGKGSFSQVYLALTETNKNAALKIAQSNSKGATLIAEEANIYKKLTPPIPPHSADQYYLLGSQSIIKYFDYFSTSSVNCLALEYFPGVELYDIIIGKFLNNFRTLPAG